MKQFLRDLPFQNRLLIYVILKVAVIILAIVITLRLFGIF